MTAQPDHSASRPGFTPPMGTLSDLREALGNWGFPGDLRRFEEELDAIDLDDLAAVRELTQAYRHRVLLRYDPQGMAALARSTEDVTDELRRKLADR
ncbi:hypothetical protein [Streptomyces lasiicapitis]|uniref:Uncharacterized protein n=1 Tax=Streptomyces lasiicapitis TaxID=1923961 RepID=A0ABQ2MUI0_9ACTN|nr:hypothetical protein [Streptomyces lasiicapitis]GGO59035.1 hypothetical protein GCM10012286_79710 [Streptomyces lasiicapitis]